MWRKWLWTTFETKNAIIFSLQLIWSNFGKNYSELRHFHSLRCTDLFRVIWPVVLILHYSNCNQPHPITCLGWMTKCALGGALCTFALLNICTLYICTFVQIWTRSQGETLGWLHTWWNQCKPTNQYNMGDIFNVQQISTLNWHELLTLDAASPSLLLWMAHILGCDDGDDTHHHDQTTMHPLCHSNK